MSVHVCKVDRSRETGSLVVCSCGLALGPFMDHATARKAAAAHRNVTQPPRVQTAEQQVSRRDAQRTARDRERRRGAGGES